MRVKFYMGLVSLTAVSFLGQAQAEEPIASPTAVPAQEALQIDSIIDEATDSSSKIKWIESYNVARRKGTDSERPLMLFVTMEQCRYCTKMEEESFASNTDELSKSFVAAKLYLDPESKLGQSLKISIFPTTMFIAPDGKILGYIRGYVPREQFTAELNAAKTANEKIARLAKEKSGTETK